jgi:hypothetical protein
VYCGFPVGCVINWQTNGYAGAGVAVGGAGVGVSVGGCGTGVFVGGGGGGVSVGTTATASGVAVASGVGVATGGRGVDVIVGVGNSVGVQLGVKVKVGRGVLVGARVGVGAWTRSRPTEQPRLLINMITNTRLGSDLRLVNTSNVSSVVVSQWVCRYSPAMVRPDTRRRRGGCVCVETLGRRFTALPTIRNTSTRGDQDLPGYQPAGTPAARCRQQDKVSTHPVYLSLEEDQT